MNSYAMIRDNYFPRAVYFNYCHATWPDFIFDATLVKNDFIALFYRLVDLQLFV